MFMSKLICGLATIAALLGSASEAPAAKFKMLYKFKGLPSDGANPIAGLSVDPSRNLYGTTEYGGSGSCVDVGCGTIFKLSSKGAETVLHAFSGDTGGDGGYPPAGVVRDDAGNLYGVCGFGGFYDGGCAYMLTPDGTFSILHSFSGNFTGEHDGYSPQGPLVLDKRGNLYGTTAFGGTANLGSIYKITPGGTETVLHSFAGGSDGTSPKTGLVVDKKGNLFGISPGGVNDSGIVFKIAANGTETILYSFAGGDDGKNPMGSLCLGPDGSLYGTTSSGGANKVGTVFKLSPNGIMSVLLPFEYESGGHPEAGVIMDRSGNLFGTTAAGGSHGYGTVYELAPDGTETTLHTFTKKQSNTEVGLVMDKKGHLYGTMTDGGDGGLGTVFEVIP
jgi:uncharacterized repeat protein (TIGR03803 family)